MQSLRTEVFCVEGGVVGMKEDQQAMKWKNLTTSPELWTL